MSWMDSIGFDAALSMRMGMTVRNRNAMYEPKAVLDLPAFEPDLRPPGPPDGYVGKLALYVMNPAMVVDRNTSYFVGTPPTHAFVSRTLFVKLTMPWLAKAKSQWTVGMAEARRDRRRHGGVRRG